MSDTVSPRLGQYSSVPFDFFILENWNFSLPVTEDLQQWERLSKEYRALKAVERFPYHQLAFRYDPDNANPSTSKPYHQLAWARMDMNGTEILASLPQADKDMIDRALRPFQVWRERVISTEPPNGIAQPVWLRTCYKLSLAAAYENMHSAAWVEDQGGIPSQYVLDNPSLYDWSGPDGWQKILIRIPGMCDAVQGSVIEDYEHEDEEYWEEQEGEDRDLALASFKSRVLIYVLDEEAMQQNLVKMMWLDIHGNCIWKTKIEPEEVRELGGSLEGGHSLYDSIDQLKNFESS